MKPEDKVKAELNPLCDVILMMIGLFFAGGGLFYGWGTVEEPGPGFLPLISGIFMAFFAGLGVLINLKRSWIPLKSMWQGTEWWRGVIIMACLFFFCIFLHDLGFLLVTFLILMVLYRLKEKPKWTTTVLFAGLTTAGFYILFQVWLESQLPAGLFRF